MASFDIREKKAADLVKALDIPKSAVSQYLSGKSQKMPSERLYSICKYLNVSEPWLLGYDVPMERGFIEKKNDILSDIIIRMRTDNDFMEVVETIYQLDPVKLAGIKQMLQAFN